MSQFQARSRNASSYSNIGNGSVIQLKLIQTQETDRAKEQEVQEQEKPQQKQCKSTLKFLPFLLERDSMNRLVQVTESPPLKTERQKKNPATILKINTIKSDRWKQNAPLKSISPQKRQTQYSNHNMIKQRSQSNAEYRNQMLQAYTERQHYFYQNDDSIQQQQQETQDMNQNSILTKHNKNDETIKSPLKRPLAKKQSLMELKQDRKQNIGYEPFTQRQRSDSVTQNDMKLPLLKQKQYVKEFLNENQQFKEWFQKSKEENQYFFPADFELKLIQMKRSIKNMKIRLKNWNGVQNEEENKKYLKEVADLILHRQQ